MKPGVKYLKILSNLFVAVGGVLFFIFLFPRLLSYFLPFVCGFVLSLIANPVVRFLEKKIKIKRKYGSALMIAAVIAAVVLACYGVVSIVLTGVESFLTYLPTMYQDASAELQRAADQLQLLIERIPFMETVDLSGLGDSMSSYVTGLVSQVSEPTFGAIGGIAKRIPDMLFGVVMGLLATYFFIADRDRLMLFLERHLSVSFRTHMKRAWHQIGKAVGGYFKAQFKIMIIIYLIIWLGLVILDVRYAWLIGFGIAFLDMLPVFGAGAVLWPWAAVKLFSGNYVAALGMMILYAVALTVHQLVQPKLVGDSVGMDPFAALFFMYIGYKFSGVFGMIVAIPIGMILLNLYEVGAFDTLTWCVREVVTDFNRFRRVKEELPDDDMRRP